MSLDVEIKVRGFTVLTEHLGLVEAERFIALVQRERWDYTQWRQQLFSEKSGEEISQQAMALQSQLGTDA